MRRLCSVSGSFYLVVEAVPLNPMSAFLYAAVLVMAFLLWQRVLRKL